MKDILIILTLTSLMGCRNPETDKKEIDREYSNLIVSEGQDKLIMISTWERLKFGAPCAFMNSKKDTIIPFGSYHAWDPMDLNTYAIVKSPDRVVGINREGEVMFDAYLWGDAQLDQISEGLFRIKRNGRIGYANKIGEIIIPCQFECAEQFKNGKAKVAFECEYSSDEMEQVEMNSDNWFYIDKKGNKTSIPKQGV